MVIPPVTGMLRSRTERLYYEIHRYSWGYPLSPDLFLILFRPALPPPI